MKVTVKELISITIAITGLVIALNLYYESSLSECRSDLLQMNKELTNTYLDRISVDLDREFFMLKLISQNLTHIKVVSNLTFGGSIINESAFVTEIPTEYRELFGKLFTETLKHVNERLEFYKSNIIVKENECNSLSVYSKITLYFVIITNLLALGLLVMKLKIYENRRPKHIPIS